MPVVMTMAVPVAVVRVVMTMVVVAMMMVAVIVMAMIMVMMAMAMAMRRRHLIGAAFGLERTLDLAHFCAEPLQHVGDHVVAPDPQPGRSDFRLEMPVAEMPGQPNQMPRVAAANFGDLLRFRDDLDQPAIVQHEGIAMGKRGAFGEVDQKRLAADRRHGAPPPAPVLEVQDDTVGERLADQVGGAKEGMGVMHGTLNR
jgi:hypothetical protein